MPCVSLKSQADRRAQARAKRIQIQTAKRRVGSKVISASNTPLKLTTNTSVRIRPHRQSTTPSRQSRQTVKAEKRAAKALSKTIKKTTKIQAKAQSKASKAQLKTAKSAQRQSRRAIRQAAHQSPLRSGRPSRDDLINAESRLGSQLFGPIPAGHRREFFHDRKNIWIWHEGWTDEYGHSRQLTVRYEARPSGVYKKLSAGKYVRLEGEELENFRRATHAYLRVIKQELYHV